MRIGSENFEPTVITTIRLNFNPDRFLLVHDDTRTWLIELIISSDHGNVFYVFIFLFEKTKTCKVRADFVCTYRKYLKILH